MSERDQDVDDSPIPAAVESDEQSLDLILSDPRKKALLLRKMGLEDGGDTVAPGKGSDGASSTSQANLTPSGKSVGSWPCAANWWAPFPGFPATGPSPVPPGYFPWPGFYGNWLTQPESSGGRSVCSQPGPSGSKRSVDTTPSDVSNSENAIELLDEAEALELVEFDPGVDPKDSWDPPKPVASFLEKHFNRTLSDAEREAIMKDFPKPNCQVMSAPKLDEQVKDQLKKKRERSTFWLREITV